MMRRRTTARWRAPSRARRTTSPRRMRPRPRSPHSRSPARKRKVCREKESQSASTSTLRGRPSPPAAHVTLRKGDSGRKDEAREWVGKKESVSEGERERERERSNKRSTGERIEAGRRRRTYMQIERALRTTLRQVFCVNLVGKQCCHLIARYSKRSLYYTCKSAIPREIERPPSRHKILSSSSILP